MSTATQTIDQVKAEAFADRVVGILNGGSLALMTSIGHRTGLFDTMAMLPPSTSAQLADAAKLNERYVREWLGAMLTGGFVEYDADGETYRLPAEHAAFLTREATPDNLAAFAQYIGLLGTVEDQIVDCFHNGGGVPYSEFGRFQEVMAEDSGQSVVSLLIEQARPMIDGIEDKLREGIDVLDAGCGRGLGLCRMAEAFPASRFVGYDASPDGVAWARANAERQGLTNLRFEVRDMATLNEPGQYDLITAFDAIHDQVDPAAMLRGIHAALAADGVFFAQDIAGHSHVDGNVDHPIGPFLYTISTMHCMTVSLAGGGAGLGAMWGEEVALDMLKAAGFNSIVIKQIASDIQNQYYICRKA